MSRWRRSWPALPPRRSLVRTPEPERLAAVLAGLGAYTANRDGVLEVVGVEARLIGDAALAAGVAVHELTPVRASLEEAFMELTRDSVEYAGGSPRP